MVGQPRRGPIRLIQTMIAPGSWAVNGGTGSVQDDPPVHGLVVRQTGERHGEIGQLLEPLRRAN